MDLIPGYGEICCNTMFWLLTRLLRLDLRFLDWDCEDWFVRGFNLPIEVLTLGLKSELKLEEDCCADRWVYLPD